MSEENELKFKRFSEDKQEQIRQLIAYTSLMGLSGKDLISIGNKLERIRKNAEAEKIWSLLDSFKVQGTGRYTDRNFRRAYVDDFKFEYGGVTYHAQYTSWDRTTFRLNAKGKTKSKSVSMKDYDEAYYVSHNQHIVRVILNVYNKDVDLETIFK